MKFYYYCLAITTLFNLSQGAKLRNSTSRRLVTQDEIETIQFTSENGECNYDLLEAALAEECPDCDLKVLLGKKNNENAARVRVDNLCRDAIRLNSKVGNQGTAYPFYEITEQGVQFDNEFYDGGTPLNAEYEPVAIIDSQGGAKIQQVYDNVAEEQLITFPDYLKDNFVDNCESQAVMCCWVQDRQANDNNGNCNDDDCYNKDPADNTDVCYVDLAASTKSNHVEGGFAIFPGDSAATGEGDAHCHGFTWPDDENSPEYRYRGNLLFYVSMYDHLETRGYVRNVPGAPMCSCIDKSPTVSRSDCTNLEVQETFVFRRIVRGNTNIIRQARIEDININFNNCPTNDNQNNDLGRWYDQEIRSSPASTSDEIFDQHIVEDCDAGDHYEEFLARKGYKLQ